MWGIFFDLAVTVRIHAFPWVFIISALLTISNGRWVVFWTDGQGTRILVCGQEGLLECVFIVLPGNCTV
jgi:hypothetical protein